LETTDLDGLLAHLKAKKVPIVVGPFDTPVCRGCIIRDPEGNELMLHQRKPVA
jgi:catechol-2,3-dioxygenase